MHRSPIPATANATAEPGIDEFDFPGVCTCTYVTSSSPLNASEVFGACSEALEPATSPESVTLRAGGSPPDQSLSQDYCLQLEGDEQSPFWLPDSGPYDFPENYEYDYIDVEFEFVYEDDPAKYRPGVVVRDSFVGGTYLGGPDENGASPEEIKVKCDEGECVANNRQCAGPVAGLEYARSCSGLSVCTPERYLRFVPSRRGGGVWVGGVNFAVRHPPECHCDRKQLYYGCCGAVSADRKEFR